MKKLLSISFALLILLSWMQLTISMHYCGGELADSKVSILGVIASCGMEGSVDECTVPSSHMDSACCNNEVSVFEVDHNFFPSFTEFNTFAQYILQVFIVPASTTIHSFTAINLSGTDVSPPGNFLVSAVSLPKICVFLI